MSLSRRAVVKIAAVAAAAGIPIRGEAKRKGRESSDVGAQGSFQTIPTKNGATGKARVISTSWSGGVRVASGEYSMKAGSTGCHYIQAKGNLCLLPHCWGRLGGMSNLCSGKSSGTKTFKHGVDLATCMDVRLCKVVNNAPDDCGRSIKLCP